MKWEDEIDDDMKRSWRAHPCTRELVEKIGPDAVLKRYQSAKTLEEARGYEDALRMVGRLIAGA